MATEQNIEIQGNACTHRLEINEVLYGDHKRTGMLADATTLAGVMTVIIAGGQVVPMEGPSPETIIYKQSISNKNLPNQFSALTSNYTLSYNIDFHKMWGIEDISLSLRYLGFGKYADRLSVLNKFHGTTDNQDAPINIESVKDFASFLISNTSMKKPGLLPLFTMSIKKASRLDI